MAVLQNYPLIAALSAILISQFIKIPIAYILRRPTSFALATSTGGMPSSHSAGVTALISGLIIEYGWQSPFVAIAITFGVIVIFDSMGVRRQSGEHGVLINELIEDFKLLRKNLTAATQEELNELQKEEEKQSREYLGHKPIEVFFGIISGIIITLIMYSFFF